MKFFVIGDHETVLGLRLVGVDGAVAVGRDAALVALKGAVAKDDVGVVLVTERVAAEIRDEVEARLYGIGFPLVLEIPDSSGPVAGRLEIEEVVRRAIGISV